MMNAQELINAITREAEGVEQSGFPLHIFPQAMQKIILDWSQSEGYVKEFSAMAMLSAISTALGNTLYIRVHSQWISNAALYAIFVGRPGLGKTPPLNAAYSPVRTRDAELMRKYCEELDAYAVATGGKNNSGIPRPTLTRFIINDFTPEAMFEAHYNNPRGIVILVDEIIGMFNSANRYASGQLIEQLLSAWSGTAISIIRKSNPKPLHIGRPCINIIGTIQTKLVSQLINKGYGDNGLLDRMLFVYPVTQKITLWATSDNVQKHDPSKQWNSIIDKVFSLEIVKDGDTILPKVLEMDKDANECFTSWWNERISEVNAIRNDADINSRVMKRNIIVARFALLFQVAKWACGEGHIQFIDKESVECAICLSDYVEDCYERIKKVVEAAEAPPMTGKEAMLKAMSDTFTTQDALAYGKSIGITDRTTQNWLKGLLADGKVLQAKKGSYNKVGICVTEDENLQFAVDSVSSVSEPTGDIEDIETETTEISEM